MKDTVGIFFVGIIYLAVVYALVRPNSQGPVLIGTVLNTFSDLVRGVAGQTYNGTTWSTGNG